MLEHISSYRERARAPGDLDIQDRAFKTETLICRNRRLDLLSFEADSISDERITPPDWEERVARAIEDADVTFVEYFLPELEQNMPYLRRMKLYSGNIVAAYGRIAEIARSQGKDVAVADIANRPLYQAYNMGVLPAIGLAAVAGARRGGPLGLAGFMVGEAYIADMTYQAARKKGTFAVKPSLSEHYIPSLNDARRVLTARNINRTIQLYPEGSSFLYIAAPAHTARVKNMLEQAPTAADSAKFALYSRLAGLDRTTRIYHPSGDGWELTERSE